MILVTFRTLALGAALSTIGEWRPQDFSHIGNFEVIMLGAIGLALYRGVRLPLFRIFMVLGVLHLSLSHVRHADLLGMLAPIFLARPLAEQFADLSADRTGATARFGTWIPAVLLALLLVVTGLSTFRTDVGPSTKITPANAVHALGTVKHGPILNDYNFGGYLDFVGISPFIDGRTELYGKAYMLRHDHALETFRTYLSCSTNTALARPCLRHRRRLSPSLTGRPTGNVSLPTTLPSCTYAAVASAANAAAELHKNHVAMQQERRHLAA